MVDDTAIHALYVGGDTKQVHVGDDVIFDVVNYLDNLVLLVASTSRYENDGPREYVVMDSDAPTACFTSLVLPAEASVAYLRQSQVQGRIIVPPTVEGDGRAECYSVVHVRRPIRKGGRIQKNSETLWTYVFDRSCPMTQKGVVQTVSLGFSEDGRILTDFFDVGATAPGHPRVVGMVAQLQFLEALRHHWSVLFRIPGTQAWLRLPFDRQLAYRLFVQRDTGGRRKRHAWLKRLVFERSVVPDCADAEMQMFLAGLLRGPKFFQWFDLEAAIVPSACEIDLVSSPTQEVRNGSERRFATSL